MVFLPVVIGENLIDIVFDCREDAGLVYRGYPLAGPRSLICAFTSK